MSDTLPDIIDGEIVRGLPVEAWPAARAIVARALAAKDAEIAWLEARLVSAALWAIPGGTEDHHAALDFQQHIGLNEDDAWALVRAVMAISPFAIVKTDLFRAAIGREGGGGEV